MTNYLRVCVAGATGWAGLGVLPRDLRCPGYGTGGGNSLEATPGRSLGMRSRLGTCHAHLRQRSGCFEAKPDVFVEFTKPDSAKANVLAALKAGAHVVIGTSGLGEDDYREIDELAQAVGRGVLAVGNFAITAVLLQKFAEIAAKYISHWGDH